MEIRDVIGSLRERQLQLSSEINSLRFDIKYLEGRVAALTDLIMDVSRETRKPTNSEGDGNASSS